VADFASGQGRD